MKKRFVAALFMLVSGVMFAQNTAPPKYALVIGNGAYTGLSRLANPVNDADDVAAALTELGFTVDKVLNGSLDQMEGAVMRLKNRLSVSGDTYGFFFYAGHGVQSNGENFLIPADANIPTENSLKNRAISVQWVLDELNDAENSLNVVVLDACRDNPFGWARSGSRGLVLVSRQPADSIIVYATSAGQTASDGTGRNGLFTGQLLKNLKTPGLEVAEMFKRTGADVAEVSGKRQIPAVYSQFFGTAFLGAANAAVPEAYRPAPVNPPVEKIQNDANPALASAVSPRSAALSFDGDPLAARDRQTVTAGLRNAMQTYRTGLDLDENTGNQAGYGFTVTVYRSQTSAAILQAEVTVVFSRGGRVLCQAGPYIIPETTETMIARRIAERLRDDRVFFNAVNRTIQ